MVDMPNELVVLGALLLIALCSEQGYYHCYCAKYLTNGSDRVPVHALLLIIKLTQGIAGVVARLEGGLMSRIRRKRPSAGVLSTPGARLLNGLLLRVSQFETAI